MPSGSVGQPNSPKKNSPTCQRNLLLLLLLLFPSILVWQVILLKWQGHTRCLCIGVCTQENFITFHIFYNYFNFKRNVEREEQKSANKSNR